MMELKKLFVFLIAFLIAIILIVIGSFALSETPPISNQISRGPGATLVAMGLAIGLFTFSIFKDNLK